MRYRQRGRQEKVTFGPYPAILIAEARLKREQAKAAIIRGESPMQTKQTIKAAAGRPETVADFARVWLTDVMEKTNHEEGSRPYCLLNLPRRLNYSRN
jgi:hypothetical protein